MKLRFNIFKRKKKKKGIRGKISESLRKFDREFLVDRGSRSLNEYSFFKTIGNRSPTKRSR